MTIHHETAVVHTHADGTTHSHDGVPYHEHGDCGHTGPGHIYLVPEDEEGGMLAVPCDVCKAHGACSIREHVRHAAPAHLDGHEHRIGEVGDLKRTGPVVESEHGAVYGRQKWVHQDHPSNYDCRQASCACPYTEVTDE